MHALAAWARLLSDDGWRRGAGGRVIATVPILTDYDARNMLGSFSYDNEH
jgi:hypothetical protein